MFSPFLTIPRARSMIWPGSQQTMGELLDQDKLSCKIREYFDGGNLPRNIDEAVAVKVADNGSFFLNAILSVCDMWNYVFLGWKRVFVTLYGLTNVVFNSIFVA